MADLHGAISIPVYRKGLIAAYAKVDPEDIGLAHYRWHLHSAGYAIRFAPPNGRSIYMHREIMGLTQDDPDEVDHIDHDTLNNRRANLRIGTHGLNLQNLRARTSVSSSYRGVYLRSDGKAWVAQIRMPGGRRKSLGSFSSEIEAAKAAAEARNLVMPFSIDEPPAGPDREPQTIPIETVSVICAHCGQDFTIPRAQRAKSDGTAYCSRQCAAAARRYVLGGLCCNGHLLDEQTLRIRVNGKSRCRACLAEWTRNWRRSR